MENVKSVSSEDAERILTRLQNIPRLVVVNNGYSVLLTLNRYKNGYEEYHLSISNQSGTVNFETAGAIARTILGDCKQLDVGFRGVYHFVIDVREFHSQQIIKEE